MELDGLVSTGSDETVLVWTDSRALYGVLLARSCVGQRKQAVDNRSGLDLILWFVALTLA